MLKKARKAQLPFSQEVRLHSVKITSEYIYMANTELWSAQRIFTSRWFPMGVADHEPFNARASRFKKRNVPFSCIKEGRSRMVFVHRCFTIRFSVSLNLWPQCIVCAAVDASVSRAGSTVSRSFLAHTVEERAYSTPERTKGFCTTTSAELH